MKTTQMTQLPQALKFGLCFLFAAGITSASVLTEPAPKEAAAAAALPAGKAVGTKRSSATLSTATKPTAKSGSPAKERGTPAAGISRKAAVSTVNRKEAESGKAEKIEEEARKIASVLTPAQRTKLLALLNSAEAGELMGIGGVGKSRGAAIEKARPIASVEKIRGIKGLGPKTFEGMVAYGRTLTVSRSKSGTPSKSTSGTTATREK